MWWFSLFVVIDAFFQYILDMFLFWKRKKEKTPLFDTGKAKASNPDLEMMKAGRLASSALSRVKELVSSIGPRPAASSQTRNCARALADAFRPVADDVLITTGQGSSKRYYGFFRTLCILTPLTVLCLWSGLPYLALILLCLFGYSFYREYYLSLPTKYSNFRARQDFTNVHAVINPTGDVQKTIIYSAHHDSAPVSPYNRSDRKALILALYIPLIVFLLAGINALVLCIVEAVGGKLLLPNVPNLGFAIVLILITLGLLPFFRTWTYIGEQFSPGAGDNLISSCLLVEASRYFFWKKQNGEGFAHTRLVFVSFDGEECGLQGSRLWYARNGELAVNAVNINIDAPYDGESLTFLTRDVNGQVALSEKLAASCAADAESMGYHVHVGPLPAFTGATDAASAARAGIEATTLLGIPIGGKADAPYHTEEDLPEALSQSVLEEVMSIILKVAENHEKVQKKEDPVLALEDSKRKFRLTNI